MLVDLTHERTLASMRADNQVRVASLTKIMTALVVLEERKLDERVTITLPMVSNTYDYVTIGLRVGQTVTVEDLLYALMLPSAADAAQALAISTSGSIAGFAAKMNAKAAALGLKQTHFSNPTGMDYDNYSSAADMAVITQEALKNPKFVEIFNSYSHEVAGTGLTAKKTFAKRPHIQGGKTGYTEQAGRCLASTASIEGTDYLLVSLGARKSTSAHLEDAEKVYTFIEEQYEPQVLLAPGMIAQNLPVNDSPQKSVNVYAETEIGDLLPTKLDEAQLEYRYEGIATITQAIKQGDKVGEYVISYQGQEVGRTELHLQEEIRYNDYSLQVGCIAAGVIFALAIVRMLRREKRRRKN